MVDPHLSSSIFHLVSLTYGNEYPRGRERRALMQRQAEMTGELISKYTTEQPHSPAPGGIGVPSSSVTPPGAGVLRRLLIYASKSARPSVAVND